MPASAHFPDSQPDLRHVVAESVNEVLMGPNVPEEHRLTRRVTPDRVNIACQRTWRDVRTANSKLDGSNFSACVALISDAEDAYSWFLLTVSLDGEDKWQPVASQGGTKLVDGEPKPGGFLIGPGSHVCIGGIDAIPDGETVQIELADGSSYKDELSDGCCIVFAPITTPPTPDDHFTVRYLGPDGSELSSETHWIGDGKPPPGVHPAT
jgi:hypothetical protein